MKKVNHLLDEIATYENLHFAFWKAQKGKQHREEVQCFQKNFNHNIHALQEQLLQGNVNVGNYHYFTIFDPKERTICAASFSERVLHHALMNVCHPVFEGFQIFHSYATRPNKGTYAALGQAYQNQKKHQWFLKTDIRKYFDSIDHRILKKQLQKKFREKRLISILFQIIDSYSTKPEKGLPIGNLTSQYFAKQYKKLLQNELLLEPKPFCLNRCPHGLPFLGYRVFHDKILLSRQSKNRYQRKLISYDNKIEKSEWTQKEYQQHLLSLHSYVSKANSFRFRQRIHNKGQGIGRGL